MKEHNINRKHQQMLMKNLTLWGEGKCTDEYIFELAQSIYRKNIKNNPFLYQSIKQILDTKNNLDKEEIKNVYTSVLQELLNNPKSFSLLG